MLTLYDNEIRHILDALTAYQPNPEMSLQCRRKLAAELRELTMADVEELQR